MLIHSNALKESFEHMIKNTPIDHFGYYIFDNDGYYFQLESDRDFFRDFLENELFLIMPFSESNSTRYEIYTSMIKEDVNIHKSLFDVAKKHSYYSFVNVIKNHNSHKEVFTFASKNNSMEIINYVINNRGFIIDLTDKIHKRLYSLYRKENCILLPKNLADKIRNFEDEHRGTNVVFGRTPIEGRINTSDEFDFSSLPFNISYYPFTAVEKDIIYLLFHGFNTNKSAEILDVSPRTIERHFEKIRKKLGCKNKLEILHSIILKSQKYL